MPTLLELQQAVAHSLVGRIDDAAVHVVAGDFTPGERLNVYRNTCRGTLINALRLSYPAVHRVVGGDFFEFAAGAFVDEQPPRHAYLDDYGVELSDFLARLPAVSALTYLPDLARLEWAVSRALYAPDADGLDLARLNALDGKDRGRVRFLPHPSLGLVFAACPADELWSAVLEGNEAAIAAFDPSAGPVRLLVQRRASGIDVVRLEEGAWRFTAALCAGVPLGAAVRAAAGIDAAALLADHLAHERFVDFGIAGAGIAAEPGEKSP